MICPSAEQTVPARGIASPNPSPGGRVGPKGRVRNAGGKPKVSVNEQTSSQPEAQEEVFRFFGIVRLLPAFLISQKSVPKSRFLPASPRGKRLVGNLRHFCYRFASRGREFVGDGLCAVPYGFPFKWQTDKTQKTAAHFPEPRRRGTRYGAIFSGWRRGPRPGCS